MTKFVFEGVVTPEEDDGGQAMIAEIDSVDDDVEFCVCLHSWCGVEGLPGTREERRRLIQHPEMDQLTGKKVRVTVEVIE